MTLLNKQQKQLIFDYCLGLVSPEQCTQAKSLIDSDTQASELYSSLKDSLSVLDTITAEPCPDELVESTVFRLCNAARSSHLQLEHLLEEEQTRITAKSGLWRNFGRRFATAAVFMIVGGALITTLNIMFRYARQKSFQYMCQMQLANIYRGVSQYSTDHDGLHPAVANTAGSPWWKIGYPGKENYSNTRPVWLLVKNGYVSPDNFVCPGSKSAKRINFDNLNVENLNDFPSRDHVTYSFRIRYCKPGVVPEPLPAQKIIIADLNPLFEKLPENYAGTLKLQLNKKLLSLNSINHNRGGQNTLTYGGSAKFIKDRTVGIEADDIFTLQNVRKYKGTEIPTCDTDAFLAP